MPKVGTGVVEIVPDLDKFRIVLERQMAAVGGDFRKFGQDAGRSFGDGFGRGTRDIDRASNSVSRLDRESRKATKGFAGLANSFGGGNNSLRKAGAALDDFGGAGAGATATVGGLRVALAALIPLTVGFGGATVSVVSALGPLVGLAAAAGNALAAAAQGFAVFKLATMGVTDALKEQVDKQDKAATAAASSAGAQRSAARAVQSAQDGVRAAAQALTDAQTEQGKALDALEPAYTAARVKLNDLREAVNDAALSLRGARLAATDARKALTDLLAGPDPLKLAEAHRAVRDSLQREDDAVQGLRDAYKALNDLLAPADVLDVADATDAVADAVRNEERARLNLTDQIAKTNATLADPASSADEQARARLDLADAENAVGDAARGTDRARVSLAKLEGGPDQDAVAAARRRVGDAERGVRDAAEGTADARRGLADAERPATAQEIAKARLDVAQAENAVGDAERERLRSTRELRDAESKGIERSAEVVQAREDIAHADRSVADAERDAARASQALSDAQLSAKETMTQTGAAAASLNEKFDKLPPAAKAFVRELQAMKPRLDELRQTAAAGFFPGATEGLKAAAQNFDSVNKVVGQTGTVLGEAARKSGELVGSPAFGRDIEIIGGRNAKVLDTLGEALRHIVSALRHVAVAAGPLTQWLADLANKWALNAAEAAKAGRESGKLAAFFEKTRAVAERLGSILGHLTSGLLGIGKAGQKSGNDILASIDRAAGRFDEWANSVKGQSALKDFFRETKDLAAALVPVLGGIAKAIGLLTLRVLPLSEALKLLGPYADEITTAFVAWKLATFGVAAATKAVMVAQAAAAIATGGWVTAFWALNAAMAANPIGIVVVALAAVAAGLIYAYHHSETFRNIVDGALRAVGDAFTWMWNAAKDVFEWLKANWPTIRDTIINPIADASTTIYSTIADIVSFFRDLPGRVVGAIKAGAQAIGDVGSWIVAQIVAGVKAVAGFAADVGGWLKNRVVEGVQAFADAFRSVGGWVLNRVAEGFRTVTDLLASVGGWLRNRVEELVHAAVDGFKAIGSWVLNRIVDGFTTVTDALGSIGGWLKNRVGDLVTAAADDFKSVGRSILGFIVDGMKSGGRLLLGFVNDIIGIINTLLDAIGVDKIKPITAKSVGLAEGGVLRLARGGAFAQTGGLVNAPMAILGEEAPSWPEFVIPTNPAYRDRARALLAQAWQTIGFAEGGIVGTVTGAVSGLLGKGVDAITGALPDAGKLPTWLRGVGSHLLSDVGGWIGKQIRHVTSLFTGDGGGGGKASPGGGGGTVGANQALGKQMMLAAGWPASQWPALRALWQGESGWNENAVNPSSGAGGIPQALPASKMGAGWQHNARQQIGWGLGYIRGTYGSPSAALSAWQSRSPHWYAAGGVIPGGITPGGLFGTPSLVEAAGGSMAGPRNGALIHIDQLVVSDPSDVNTIAARLAWLIEQG